MDPYLNVDAGLMSPYEHGETFVLDDGTEVDLDFGTVERFMDIRLSRANSITSGLVYKNVIDGERQGKYMGKTVQVVPHVTNEILRQIDVAASTPVRVRDPDICLLELGGTVGDIEGAAFLEALRQLRAIHKDNFCHIHCSLVPVVNEQKSKPTQHSFKELRYSGLSPDFIFCRCEVPVNEEVRRKISLFCMVPMERVVSVHNVDNIYMIPRLLKDQGVPGMVMERLRLNPIEDILSPFDLLQTFDRSVKIAIVGKYAKLEDSYVSVIEALQHACHWNKVNLNIQWLDPESIEEKIDADGILVPGGFGVRETDGKILACKVAREQQIPFLGICYGFQLAVIEFFRSLGLDVGTEEVPGNSDNAFVKKTMKKGLHDVHKDNRIYKERFRHRYGYKHNFEAGRGMNNPQPGFNEHSVRPVVHNERRTRVITEPIGFKLPDHPYYVGVQYHPEFLSRFAKPHPVFRDFISVIVNGTMHQQNR
jgi:CTP synthase